MYIVSYTLYNESLGILDTNDSMFGFGQIENTTSFNLYIPNKDSVNANIGATVSTLGAVDTVSLHVSSPALYSDNGAHGASVPLEFYYRKTNGDHSYNSPNWILYSPSTAPTGWDTIKAGSPTKSETVLTVKMSLPSTDFYDIKIVRAASSIDNPSDLSISNSVYLKEITEISYEDLAYPCTALLGIRAKATDQLSGSMPTVTSIVRGITVKVPTGYVSTYDGHRSCGVRYQSGTWDGTMSDTPVWTDNPVWCLYDFLTNNRYGLGEDFKILESKRNLMLANFFTMAQYCDTYITDTGGETTHDDPAGRPRFSLNIVIDQQKSAREWINTICASMRATLYNCEGVVFLDIDRPKPITQLFNMSNITNYVQSGVSFKSIPNSVQVQFPNIEKEYQPDSFLLETFEYQQSTSKTPVTINLDLVGVTNYKDARSMGAFVLDKAITSSTTITFKTGTDSLLSTVLDVIGVQHDVPMWGSGGRITSISGNTLTLSTPFNYTLIDRKDGSLFGDLSIALTQSGQTPVSFDVIDPIADGTYTTVTIVPDADFNANVGDPYIINFTTNLVKPFRIVNIKRDTDEFVEVTAIEYVDGIYSDSISELGKVDVPNYSSLPLPSKTSITGFKAEKASSPEVAKTFRACIDVWYSVPSDIGWKGLQVAYAPVGSTTYKYTEIDSTGHIQIIEAIPKTENYTFIGLSYWKDGTRQSIEESLADTSNTPYAIINLPATITTDVFSTSTVGNLRTLATPAGTFLGRDCIVNWDAIASDGVIDTKQLLDYYVVTVKNIDGTARRTERVTDETYVYTHGVNVQDPPKVARSFDVTVVAVDIFGRISLPSTLRCSNPAPAAII